MQESKPDNDVISTRRRLLDWMETDGVHIARRIADGMCRSLQAGGTVYACGNGGSASQAEHFAAELVGRFKVNRRSLRVQALTANSATATALANDFGFPEVFAHQLEGIAREGDCLLALSTSGESTNVVRACEVASRVGMHVFALAGRGGGTVGAQASVALCVPDRDTARIQEMHLLAVHLICEIIENTVFSSTAT